MSYILTEEKFINACNEHGEILANYLVRSCDGNSDQALDLLQEVFLRAWKGRESFRGDCSLKSWFFTIAINVFREKIRRKKLVRFVAEIPDVQGRAQCPLASSIANEVQTRINEEFANLPKDQQEVFDLIRNHGMSYKEVANELNLTVSSVRMRLHRANVALVAGLQDMKEVLDG